MIVEESVHEAITEGRNGDATLLRVAHRERAIRTMTVRTRLELVGERAEVRFQMVAEMFEFSRPLFATHKLLPTMPQRR